jgi:cyclic pyranopterin phosphate synthase
MHDRIPQLRIAVNAVCGKACTYCRPRGEVAGTNSTNTMSVTEIVRLTELIGSMGVHDIKLTGGDPGLYREIVTLVAGLRKLEFVRRIELVTRHPRCGKLAKELRGAGLDTLKFSLDSLDSSIWTKITGVSGHKQLVAAIEEASQSGISVKINMVILKGVNDHEVPHMISFCRTIGAPLKLLDLIVDISEHSEDMKAYADQHYDDLLDLTESLRNNGWRETIRLSSGGLGHPMPVFHSGDDNPPVQIKTSRMGAWYGKICETCQHFPCHDALMALRLTPDGKLQRCLLRSDNLIDLLTPLRRNDPLSVIEDGISEALTSYQTARFYEFEEFSRLRADPESLLSG